MLDLISEDDLRTFEGWLRYQAVDPATTTTEELENWRSIFEDAKKRSASSPKVGLMKLQPISGEYRYAVAIQDNADLWLTLWVRRSRKGEFFVMLPRGDRDWDPHTSYHLDGTLHMKSYGSKVVSHFKRQPLTGPFQGTVDLGYYAGHGPKTVGAICDPKAFIGVLKIPPGVLGPRDGVVKVDLIEPGHDPMDCPELQVINQMRFCDVPPYVVVRVGALSAKS